MASSSVPVARSITLSLRCSKAFNSTCTGRTISGFAWMEPASLRLYFLRAVALQASISVSLSICSKPSGFSKASNSLNPTRSSISAVGQNCRHVPTRSVPSGAGTGAGGGDLEVRLGGAANLSAFLAASEGLGVFGGAFFFFCGTGAPTEHSTVPAMKASMPCNCSWASLQPSASLNTTTPTSPSMETLDTPPKDSQTLLRPISSLGQPFVTLNVVAARALSSRRACPPIWPFTKRDAAPVSRRGCGAAGALVQTLSACWAGAGASAPCPVPVRAGAGAGASCVLGACFSLTVQYTAPAPKSWPLNAWHAASASLRIA
mmetsp:Transcript_18691/g.53296  ORF Transcript_18691/g.53296 Transcript_18691/m.53296 type:complete len:318 (+) Transcript_18691:2482-3435(+)